MHWDDSRRLLIVDDGFGDPGSRALARMVATGTHLRIRRGVYVETAVWRVLKPDERLVLRILALHLTARSRPVLSHWSASALLGLPVPYRATDRVDLAVDAGRNRAVAGARVHLLRLQAAEVVEVHGILCTSVARTGVDLAADAGFEVAVSFTDAALARLGPDGREMPAAAADLADRSRGRSRMQQVFAFADPRSGSPGESMSRVRMHRLGFIRPELQVEIVTDGLSEWSDFGWEEVLGAGEFDGEVKYRDARYRGGGAVEDVVIREKDRENRIRRRRPRFARWNWVELQEGRLDTILREAGIPKRNDSEGRGAA